MFALLGVGAGAAASRLIPRKGQKELKKLQKREKELALQVDELQCSLRLSHTDEGQKQRIEELQQQALQHARQVQAMEQELQREKDEAAAQAARQAEELEAQRQENRTLALQCSEWSERSRQQQEAAAEAEREMAALRASHASELSEYQEQLDRLRAQVADTMSKLLAHDISDKDAVQAMEGLGCKVTYIEAPPASTSESEQTEEEKRRLAEWEQPQLLLNDRARLERLVSASRGLPCLHSSDASGPDSNNNTGLMRRLPVVSFPELKSGSLKSLDHTGSADAQAKPQLTGSSPTDTSTSAQPHVAPASSKKGSDQTAATPRANITMGGGKPGKKGADQGGNKPDQGVKFTYSLQGSKGNQWIAKVPASGGPDSQAGLAYLSSDNSPKLRGAPAFPAASPVPALPTGPGRGFGLGEDDDVGFSSSRELSMSRF